MYHNNKDNVAKFTNFMNIFDKTQLLQYANVVYLIVLFPESVNDP